MNTHVHTSHSVSQVGPLMDKRVEIHGTSRADMNGKRGVATDFHIMGGQQGDRATWRYTVQLDSGEAFKVKPARGRRRARARMAKRGKVGAREVRWTDQKSPTLAIPPD